MLMRVSENCRTGSDPGHLLLSVFSSWWDFSVLIRPVTTSVVNWWGTLVGGGVHELIKGLFHWAWGVWIFPLISPSETTTMCQQPGATLCSQQHLGQLCDETFIQLDGCTPASFLRLDPETPGAELCLGMLTCQQMCRRFSFPLRWRVYRSRST